MAKIEFWEEMFWGGEKNIWRVFIFLNAISPGRNFWNMSDDATFL